MPKKQEKTPSQYYIDRSAPEEKSAEQLKAIIENINGGVSVVVLRSDKSVSLAYANERYYEIFGYTKEQFISELKAPHDVIFPEDAEYAEAMIAGVESTRRPASFKYRAFKRDKSIVHIRCSTSVAAIEGLGDTVLLSVLTDITSSEKADEMILAQQKQMAGLINALPSGIAVIEADPKDIPGSLRTTYYNDRFYGYSGYSRDEYDVLLQKDQFHFVLEEDKPCLLAAIEKLCAGSIGISEDSVVRCHTRDGGYCWLLLTGQLVNRRDEVCVINVVSLDISGLKTAEDKQRISEEMLRIAAETDRRALILYDIKANTCRVESRSLFLARYGEILENIPQSLLERGVPSPGSADDLCALFARIRAGERQVSYPLQLQTGQGEYQWFECNATVVFDADQNPDQAVLVLHNITQQRVKEAVFKKWQQSIDAKPSGSYSLFRCNLSRDASLDEQAGDLLQVHFSAEAMSFDARTREYAEQYVYDEDREEYLALLDADTLLAKFYRDEHMVTMDYREKRADGDFFWRRLTVEMVEYMDSTDVQAFLMYEDIDEQKRAELRERELAETDPLTGALNRAVFSEKADAVLSRETGKQHALLMMDVDGFKLVNDTFGHAAGDQALVEIAAVLRSQLGQNDLVCRLGGDEFLVLLQDVPYDAVIEKKARQICELVRKAYSPTVQISASIGIAVFPRDGSNFDELYRNADKGLYRVKQSGRDSYTFFSAGKDLPQGGGETSFAGNTEITSSAPKIRHRMLIVDDSEVNRTMLAGLFKKEFLIETAKNGNDALVRLRHFGTSISVVLLDLGMPGMDGFEVLKRMQNNLDLRVIPVIVVSADNNYQTSLKAIKYGAADYVTKPVDANLIRVRVYSAISKADNERLRAQNSYLQLQRSEEVKFHTVLDSTGTVVVEYDWRNHVFTYDKNISRYVAGNYDNRGMWAVFLTDMVADVADVKTLQETMLSLANDRSKTRESSLVLLRTPAKVRHWFRMNIYKETDDYGLAEKMIITLNDVHEEVLANEKLLFQATRDELTGLYNRSGFIEKAGEMIAGKPAGYYVMSCIDIENFKVINDQYGVEKGDETLRKVAESISRAMAELGGICCRYTADNFGLMYPAEHQGSRTICALQEQAATSELTGRSIKVRVGRYLIDDLTLSVSVMYDRATMAQESIRGRYDINLAVYNDSMRASLVREQQLVNDMDAALTGNEFEAWFQPQYNHATGALIGAEALVRWKKDGRYISPAEFVPVFERNGFIYEMDQNIWEQVCKMLRRRMDEGKISLPVSVNISRRDLQQKNIIEVLTGLVEKYGIPYELLRLEVTESAFVESGIIEVVDALIGIGFTVEIDDFGSGYSSLNTLKDVPASILKLDMKFFENTKNSQRSGNIVESVVRMAKWLDMAVIAEGVEDKAQADYLKSIGCYYIQGYYYAKPMPMAEYEALLAAGKQEPKLSRLKTLETLDNSEFWNPKSMDTLIFNSYVGGACIFEYHNGKTELLRINDQYIREFGELFPVGAQLPDFDLSCLLVPEERQKLFLATREAIETQRQVSCEICAADDTHTEYVRVSVRMIAHTADRFLCYSVVQNMTEQRMAQDEAKAASDKLRTVMNHAGNGITAIALHDNAPEFLFANDKYYEIIGYTREEYRKATAEDMLAPIFHEDRESLRRLITEVNEKRQSATAEFRVQKKNGDIVWVRTAVTITTLAGTQDPVQIAVFSDISDEKEINGQLRFLNESAHDILAQADCEKALRQTLQKLLEYFAGDRCYIVELDYERQVTNNTYEVCADAVTSEQGNLQGLPFAASENWFDALRKNEFYVINRVEQMEDAQSELRAMLLSQGIHSIILAPLWRDGVMIGFVGIDNPAGMTDHLGRLMAIGDYLAVLLTRRDLERKIEGDNLTMQMLMNDTPGGFVRMKVLPDGRFVPLYSNKGMQELTGMSREELVSLYGQDVLAGVHPDDREVVSGAARQTLADGKAQSACFRMKNGSGGYRWMNFFGRMTKDASGETYLNVYYADATRQVDEEQRQKALLDNLPCGAALYEYDGRDLAVIHINNRYWALVEREPVDYSRASVFGMIHPDDRVRVRQEMEAAVAQQRNITADFRVRCGSGDYRPFHVSANVTREAGGKYLFYTTYTPVSEQELSMQQMMPYIFPAIMQSSADLTFAKDKDFRYLCCSHAYASILGLEDENAVVGKTDYELFAKHVADHIRKDDVRLIADGVPIIDRKETIPTGTGLPCYSRISKYLLRDSTGNVLGIYGIGRDITEKQEASDQLRLLTETIPGGLATFACSRQEYHLEYYNDGFCALFGYTKEELPLSVPVLMSHIREEDRPMVDARIAALVKQDTPIDCVYRIRTKDGLQKWVRHKANAVEHVRESVIINAVFLDVTEQEEEKERLRVSEELNRLAIEHSGNIITRFDVEKRTLTLPDTFNPIFKLPHILENMPQEQIALGRVSADTAAAYTELFESILRGETSGSATYKQNSTEGWRWLEAQFTTVFSNTGKPVSAVISFTDITEKLEKEIVYDKWQQSLAERPEESYTLFRCNLSKGAAFDSMVGSLLRNRSGCNMIRFDKWVTDYAAQYVYRQDFPRFTAFANSDTMLAEYYRGHRTDTLEYRECTADGSTRWVRLSADLVEYPNSRDVEAYLMFENIDEQKKADLLTLERSEKDPLTGILNRATFISRMEQILSSSGRVEKHALFMLDVDNFKGINDTLGHGAGDQVLRELTTRIASILRPDDLIGRLGGDEFFVFMKNIPSEKAAASKARQICEITIRSGEADLPVTASIGIAMIPQDGSDFDTLYRKVDAALYEAKRRGKDGFLFASEKEQQNTTP